MKRAHLFCFVILIPFLIFNCASTPYTTTFTEIDDLIEEGASQQPRADVVGPRLFRVRETFVRNRPALGRRDFGAPEVANACAAQGQIGRTNFGRARLTARSWRAVTPQAAPLGSVCW